MPGLSSRSAAVSKKSFKKAGSRTRKKEGGGESPRDIPKSAGYNYEMPKQVDSDASASSEAAGVRNIFIKDVIDQISSESPRMSHYSKRSTITSREIHTAMRLLMSRELAKHAGPEGIKTATKYTSAKRA